MALIAMIILIFKCNIWVSMLNPKQTNNVVIQPRDSGITIFILSVNLYQWLKRKRLMMDRGQDRTLWTFRPCEAWRQNNHPVTHFTLVIDPITVSEHSRSTPPTHSFTSVLPTSIIVHFFCFSNFYLPGFYYRSFSKVRNVHTAKASGGHVFVRNELQSFVFIFCT